MEQFSMFDYLGKREDDLYQNLVNLTNEDMIQLGDYSIELNQFDLYVVFTNETEMAFSSLNACYNHLADVLLT